MYSITCIFITAFCPNIINRIIINTAPKTLASLFFGLLYTLGHCSCIFFNQNIFDDLIVHFNSILLINLTEMQCRESIEVCICFTGFSTSHSWFKASFQINKRRPTTKSLENLAINADHRFRCRLCDFQFCCDVS